MLGDRIGIMKEGAIVQIGTPQQIVTEPASDYVKSFVENVDRSRVLTVASAGSEQLMVSKTDEVEKAVRIMEDMDIPFIFVLQDGRPEGFVRLDDAQEESERDDPRLEHILNPPPDSVKPDDHLIDILTRATRVHTPLPVIDENGRLQAVVTKDMLLQAIAGGAS